MYQAARVAKQGQRGNAVSRGPPAVKGMIAGEPGEAKQWESDGKDSRAGHGALGHPARQPGWPQSP